MARRRQVLPNVHKDHLDGKEQSNDDQRSDFMSGDL